MNLYFSSGIYPADPLLRRPGVFPGAEPAMGQTGIAEIFREEQRSWEDAKRLQASYPYVGKEIQQYVENECDQMEYEGSLMFDEYPDRLSVTLITDRIYDKVYDKVKDYHEKLSNEPEDLYALQCRGPGCDTQRRDWVHDLIQIMLMNEMHQRRCRHRRCRVNR